MTDNQVAEFPVLISISDPWDFGTECGVGPFSGQCHSLGQGEYLVKLEHSISYRDRIFQAAIVRPRHAGINISSVPDEVSIESANILLIERLDESQDEEGTEGIAVIGSMISQTAR
jgi:hypothetical protein